MKYYRLLYLLLLSMTPVHACTTYCSGQTYIGDGDDTVYVSATVTDSGGSVYVSADLIDPNQTYAGDDEFGSGAATATAQLAAMEGDFSPSASFSSSDGDCSDYYSVIIPPRMTVGRRQTTYTGRQSETPTAAGWCYYGQLACQSGTNPTCATLPFPLYVGCVCTTCPVFWFQPYWYISSGGDSGACYRSLGIPVDGPRACT